MDLSPHWKRSGSSCSICFRGDRPAHPPRLRRPPVGCGTVARLCAGREEIDFAVASFARCEEFVSSGAMCIGGRGDGEKGETERQRDRETGGEGRDRRSALVPSPLYSGERVRVRGHSGELRGSVSRDAPRSAPLRNSTSGPSPQPSPLRTGEREQETAFSSLRPPSLRPSVSPLSPSLHPHIRDDGYTALHLRVPLIER